MKRNEVKEEYKWKVEDLFPTDEDFEKAYADAEKMIDFSRFFGKTFRQRRAFGVF